MTPLLNNQSEPADAGAALLRQGFEGHADILVEAVRKHVRVFPWMVGSGELRAALQAYEAATGAAQEKEAGARA